jgi:hypothetical protein
VEDYVDGADSADDRREIMPHIPGHSPTLDEEIAEGAVAAGAIKGVNGNGKAKVTPQVVSESVLEQFKDVSGTGFDYGGTGPTGLSKTPLTEGGKYDPAVTGTRPKGPDAVQPELYDLGSIEALSGYMTREDELGFQTAKSGLQGIERPDSALASIDIGEYQRLAGMGQYGSEQRAKLFDVERELMGDVEYWRAEGAAASNAFLLMAERAMQGDAPEGFAFDQEEMLKAGRAMAKADAAEMRLNSLQDLRARLDTMNQRGLQSATFPQIGALTGLLSNLFGVGPETFEGLQNLPTSAVSGLIPMLFEQGAAAQQAGVAQTQRQQQQEQQGQLGTALQSLFPTMQGVEAFGAFPSLVPQLFGRRQQAQNIGFQQGESGLARTEAGLERNLQQQQLTQQKTQFEAQMAEQETQRALGASQFTRQMGIQDDKIELATKEFTEMKRQFDEGRFPSAEDLASRVDEWKTEFNLDETQTEELREEMKGSMLLAKRQIEVREAEQDLLEKQNLARELEQTRLIEQQATQTGQMGGLAELIAGMSGIPELGGQAQGLALQPQLIQLLLQQALGSGGGQQGMMRTSFR